MVNRILFRHGPQKEAFRNVVGVAKSLTCTSPYQSGSRQREWEFLISRLPASHRTPARGTQHRNLTIASCTYACMGEVVASLEHADGVVKMKFFPDDPSHDSPTIEAARCNRISEHVSLSVRLLHLNNDPRLANHLYPIHVTGRYIKTQFRERTGVFEHVCDSKYCNLFGTL